MSAMLRDLNLKGGCLGEVRLKVVPGNVECHHFCQTGYLTLVVSPLAHDNVSTRIHIKQTPGIRRNVGERYVVFYLSDGL